MELRTGKAGVHVLDRSVRRILHGVLEENSKDTRLSSAPVWLAGEESGALAVLCAANTLGRRSLFSEALRRASAGRQSALAL